MENGKKTAMQDLSERVDKIIEYYSDTHGVPSAYHFKLLKSLIDSEYMDKEKKQLIDAYSQGKKDLCNYDPERHGNKAPDAKDYYKLKFK